jgi:hypothetical protein
MLNVLADKARYAKLLLNENSTTILTGIGVVGTVTTAYLSGSAAFKAGKILEESEQQAAQNEENGHGIIVVGMPLKIKMTWRLYIPAVLTGAATITAIIFANKIASKKIAALAIAGGLSDRALQEYKEKVASRWGENKARGIHDEIAQDRVDGNPVGGREVILAGSGDVLCFDMLTGRYFTSSIEEIKRAENKINHELNNFMSASLTEFYDEIGLPATTYSDSVGWNGNNQVEVIFSTTMSSDNRPCIAIDFANAPIPEYHRVYD